MFSGKSPLFATDLLPYTTLMYGNGPGHKITDNKRPDIRDVDTSKKLIFHRLYYDIMWPFILILSLSAADDYIQQSAVPLDSETHGGKDVALFARGPMAHLFQGVYEQNYIAHAMAYASCVGTNQEHCAVTAPPEKIPFTSTDVGGSAPDTPLCTMMTLMLSVLMSVLLH